MPRRPRRRSEPPATPPTTGELTTRISRARAVRRAWLRRMVLDGGRIDVLAEEVLGYTVKPFHRGLLQFQELHRKSLQLAPRGFGKSTTLTITRALFEVLRDPDVRVLIVSNTQLQAEVFLREVKHHLEYGEVLREVFGDFVSDDKWDVRELNVRPRKTRAKESTISCVGVGGPVVSRHYDVILADDLIDEENSRTEGQREKVREWFWRSLMPTLEPHGRIHVLGTRYHFADLYGVLIEGDFADCHQVVKALPEDGTTPWPEKFSVEWLEDRRRSMGTLLFNSQYQNDTLAMRGRIFQTEWFRWFETPPQGLRVYQGVDLAISQKETADYFAHVTVGFDAQRNAYVLDAVQRRMTFKAQTDFIIERQRAYRPIKVLVEAVAYQQAQVDELRRAGVYAQAVRTSKDKNTRFVRLAARFEAGQVFLRRGMQDELVEQLLLAPEGRHDDLVDALEFAVGAEQSLYLPAQSYSDALHRIVDTMPAGRVRDRVLNDDWEPWSQRVEMCRDPR